MAVLAALMINEFRVENVTKLGSTVNQTRIARRTEASIRIGLIVVLGLADSAGNISHRRFMAALIDQQRGFSTADLWARFCQMDTDRNGPN